MGRWLGRWHLHVGELIFPARLTDEERERARNPDEHLPPSEVLREWWGYTGQGGGGYQNVAEVASEIGIQPHVIRHDPQRTMGVIAEAIRSGRLIALRHQSARYSQARARTPRTIEPAQEVGESLVTWFEVSVVDDLGDPISGVELVFTAACAEYRIATDASGIARLDGARAASASVRLADVQVARAKVEPRWNDDDSRDRPSFAAEAFVFEVCAANAVTRMLLSAETRRTIVLAPPYRVRLHDEDGNTLPGLRCTASIGAARYQLASNDEGWIEFPLRDACPETATIEWEEQHQNRKLTRRIEVALACHEGDPNAVAMARLHNLGYPVAQDPEWAMALFEADFDLLHEPMSGGEIPAATRERIMQLWGGPPWIRGRSA
jgi:hypothetical protein